MKGKIVKGIAGFYYVSVPEGLVECKAKGIFRNRGISPMVGDNAVIELLDREKMTGNITDILERENTLLRPAVANVSLAVLVFAAAKPEPVLNLLDRMLISMEQRHVNCLIVFNKCDLISDEKRESLRKAYEKSGRDVLFVSARNRTGTAELTERIKNKTAVLAGPSGVGKSTIMNLLVPDAEMETGSISDRIDRGKHTTRHSELFRLDEGTFITDTPGFSALDITGIDARELKSYYPEFSEYEDVCRFGDCVHVGETGCGVKEAVESGGISQVRYDNYRQIYNEIKEKRRY